MYALVTVPPTAVLTAAPSRDAILPTPSPSNYS
jgi:hypothetical protein